MFCLPKKLPLVMSLQGLYSSVLPKKELLIITTIFIEYLLNHLASFHVDTSSLVIQTDNETEFVSGAYRKKSLFILLSIVSKQLILLFFLLPPPYNSDIKVSHKLIENECYAKMTDPTLTVFLQQSSVYLDWFNHTGYNSYKKGSLYTLLQEKNSAMNTSVLRLSPCIVDTFPTKQKILLGFRETLLYTDISLEGQSNR